MFPMFSEEAPKWSASFLVVPVWSGLVFPIRNTRGSPLLSPGVLLYHLLYDGASLWGILTVPKFSLILMVFPEFLKRTASRLRATSWEVCFLPSVVLVSIRRRSIQIDYLISNRILSVAVFPHVLWGGEEKIGIIEKFVSNVFRFLISDLPCHIVPLHSAIRV